MRVSVERSKHTRRITEADHPVSLSRRARCLTVRIPTSNEGDFMARIIVTTDPTTDQAAPVLLDESVYSLHLDNDHHAAQLIERLGWAISDAEEAEHARTPARAAA